MKHWLVKSEPFKYSWDDFVKEGKAVWDGVRNYAARNNMRAMKKGDLVLFYHSNEGLCIVGIAKVSKEAIKDPTSDEDWSVVEIKPFKKLKIPVTLQQVKADKRFETMELVRLMRLSVSAVKPEEFDAIMDLGGMA